jgi:radical SAM protein with 4Fe4S-binding SPASM domain
VSAAADSYAVRPDVSWEERDLYYVLGGGGRSGLQVADRSAIEILESLGTAAQVDDVVQGVARSRGVEPALVETSVREAIVEFNERGLLQPSESGVPAKKRPRIANSRRFSHLFFELTSRCNLRCKHCYMEAGLARPSELRLQDFLNLVEEFSSLGGTYLTLSGGEPLLFPAWAAVAEVGAERGLRLSLMTNGTFLDRKALAIVERLNINVGLGLDGFTAASHDANRGRGSFAQAQAALRLLVDHGYQANTTICFTPMRTSVYDLPALVDEMLALGLPRLYISLLEDRGRARYFRERIALTPEQRRWLLTYLYDVSCATLGTLDIEVTHHTEIFARLLFDGASESKNNLTIRIPSDGEVYLSAYMGAPEHCVGKVGEQSLAAILDSDAATAILAACERRVERIPKCASCVFKKVCRGGSAVLAHSKFGTFEEPDEFCDARIALFETVAARQARRAGLVAA